MGLINDGRDTSHTALDDNGVCSVLVHGIELGTWNLVVGRI